MRMQIVLQTIVLATLIAVLMQTPARAYEMPYDPYPWCAVYGGAVVALRIADSSPSSSAGPL